MNIGYADFVRLCRVDDPENWRFWLSVRGDGVYVKVPPVDADLEPNERAILTEHPTGSLNEPALRFPCELPQLQHFLEQQGAYGCIDPFDMADWVMAYKADQPAKPDKAMATIERNTLLTIIAAVCYDDAIDYTERGAAARIAKLTDEIKAFVSEDTVKRHIDKIPDALRSREK